MRKFLTLILCTILAMNCSAISVVEQSYDYLIGNTQITIEFASNSIFSDEKQQQIANHIIYGDDGVSTYALCWLTGHDYVYENVSLIEHKVYVLSPRCLKKTYSVETCSKCDHVEETLISHARYACCAEE